MINAHVCNPYEKNINNPLILEKSRYEDNNMFIRNK